MHKQMYVYVMCVSMCVWCVYVCIVFTMAAGVGIF